MNYRVSKLLAEKTLNTTGVETINLNVSDPISRINIRYKVTRVGYVMGCHPAGDITKIELVEGSEVLHSLTGYENQALCIYDRKVPTMVHGQHYAGNAEESEYGIDFGRFLWDTEYAFLPTRFKNPQLKVSYNSQLCDPAGTSPALEVIADLFDEKQVSPRGFLMAQEIFNSACPAENAYDYVDLPTDHSIRQMIIRAFHDGHEPWDSVKAVRLSEDNDKRVPLEWLIEEYHRVMKGQTPIVEENCIGLSDADGNVFYITPSDYYCTILATGNAVGDPPWAEMATPGGKVTLKSTAQNSFKGIARGYLPNHCVRFPFGLQNDPSDWYKVGNLGGCRLRIQGGSSGISGAVQVVLQQERLY